MRHIKNRGGWAGPTILLTSTKWSQKCPTSLCGVGVALYLALFSIAVVACCRYDDMVNHIDAHCLGCFLKLCRYRIIIAACLVVAAWVVMNERERCGVVE